MSDTQSPWFASSDLQEAIDEARSTLEGFDDARNQVSSDIKQLEAYLERLGLKTPFRYGLGKALVDRGDHESQYVAASLDLGGSASGTIEEESLVWAEAHGGRFRLLYERAEWDGSVELDIAGGPFFWDESTKQLETRPLIETKFETRKRMYTRLPDFVRALSNHLKVERLGAANAKAAEAFARFDDLPF